MGVEDLHDEGLLALAGRLLRLYRHQDVVGVVVEGR